VQIRSFIFICLFCAAAFAAQTAIAENAKTYIDLCVKANEKGDYEAALLHCNTAIALDNKLINAYNNRAIANYNLRNYEEAIVDYTHMLKLDPFAAVAYNNRGLVYDSIDEHKKAIADYDLALKIDPNYAQCYVNRGVAYANLNDYINASKDAKKACELGECRLFRAMRARGDLSD
jgi:tetratricopeptide (TPR) repeat protein